MIIVQATDGLGNQLFQYAIGRKLSLLYKTDLFIDTTHFIGNKHRKFSLKFFNTKFSEINNYKRFAIKHPVSFLKLRSGIITNFQEDYTSSVNDFRFTKNSFLKGYWGNENYFKDIRDVLLSDLQVRNNYESRFFYFLKKEISQDYSVSIHIRRGDYLESRNQAIFLNLDWQYYAQAVELIKSKVLSPKFFIFSDDIQWAKNNLPLQLSDATYINEAKELKDFEELMLMSYCSHNIIANSTFSWWAAWLNRNKSKIVIQPKKWYKAKVFQESYESNETLYCDKFIKI
jgi:hypothetical protein